MSHSGCICTRCYKVTIYLPDDSVIKSEILVWLQNRLPTSPYLTWHQSTRNVYLWLAPANVQLTLLYFYVRWIVVWYQCCLISSLPWICLQWSVEFLLSIHRSFYVITAHYIIWSCVSVELQDWFKSYIIL